MTLTQVLRKSKDVKQYYVTAHNETLIYKDYDEVIANYGHRKVRFIHTLQNVIYIKVL